MMRCDGDAVYKLAMHQGFIHLSEPGTLLIIPPGFTVMAMDKSSVSSAQGVRWQLPGTHQTRKYCRATLDVEELAESKMQTLYEFLEGLDTTSVVEAR